MASSAWLRLRTIPPEPELVPAWKDAAGTPRESTMTRSVNDLSRDDWSGVRAVVAGFGVSGFAAADNLTHLGASVVALDERSDGKEEQAELLGVLGADVRLGEGTTTVLPGDADLLVVSPGWR